MFNQAIISVSPLLLGFGILLIGNGLLGTLLGLRASIEQFPNIVTGLLMSAYFIGFILGSLYCPLLIRKVGHIRAFSAMAAICAAVVVAHGLIVNPYVWGVLRILAGLCLVGLYTIVESWLNEQASNQIRGKILAIYTSVSLASLALGQYLILLADPKELTLFALGSVLFTLGLVPIALTEVKEPVLKPVQRVRFVKLFQVSPLGIYGVLTSGLVNSAFFGMGAVYAHSIGLSTLGIAIFMSSVIIGGAILQWPIGHLSDRIDRRLVLIYVNLAAAVLALTALFMIRADSYSGFILSLVAFLYGGHVLAIYSVSIAHVSDRAERDSILETTSALLLIYGVGAAIGPLLAGILMNVFEADILPGYFATILASMSLFSAYRMIRQSPVPSEQKEPFVAMTRSTDVILNLYSEHVADHGLSPESLSNAQRRAQGR